MTDDCNGPQYNQNDQLAAPNDQDQDQVNYGHPENMFELDHGGQCWNTNISALSSDEKLRFFEKISAALVSVTDDHTKTQTIVYNIVKFDNVELLEYTIKEWKNRNAENPRFEQTVNEHLSSAFDELQTKNVLLTNDMRCAVVKILIDYQFFCEKNEQNANDVEASLVDVHEIIITLCEQIGKLITKYSAEGENEELDETFICIARFVACNIRILKRLLKSTYDQLPWEEMEFCLVVFISSETIDQELNYIYKLVLDKYRILNHLKYFCEKLSVIVPTQFKETKPKISDRAKVVEYIIRNNNHFKGMYSDFEIIKNVYSLTRADKYINLATTVDVRKNIELGKSVIKRALQVTGECLKNTLDSPNVSDDVQKLLLHSAPRNLREIITPLRDSLSHINILERNIQTESINILQFFLDLQNDITKISKEVKGILYMKKVDAIKSFARKILNLNDINDVKKIRKTLKNIDILNDSEINFVCSNNLKIIESLVKELHCNIIATNGDDSFDDLFSNIEKIIENSMKKNRVSEKHYVEFFDLLKFAVFHSTKQSTIKSICRTILIDPMADKSSTDLNEIVQLLKQVSQKAEKCRNFQKDICPVFYKIYCIISYKECTINGIEELKKSLEKNLNSHQSNKNETIANLIKKIKNCLETESIKDAFSSGVEKLKSIFDAKQQLVAFFEGLEENTELLPNEQEICNLLMKQSEMSQSQQRNLQKLIKSKPNSNKWIGCINIVDKTRDSYKTFFNSITKPKEEKKFNQSKIVEDFLKPLFEKTKYNNKKQGIINAVNSEILKQEENQQKSCFYERLKILREIISLKDCSRSDKRENQQIQAAVEMVMLDLTEILQKNSLLGDNRLIINKTSPVLIGRSLRNYLAHGDVLFDNLPLNPSLSLEYNTVKFINEGNNLINIEDCLVGQKLFHDVSYVKNRFDKMLNYIDVQNKMFLASKEGEVHNAEKCVRSGADIRAKNIDGLSALNLAAQNDKLEFFKFCLSQNVNNLKYSHFRSSLFTAAANGSISIINHIFKIAGNNISDIEKSRLWQVASSRGQLGVIKLLLDYGFKLESNCNYKILHLAIVHDRHNVVDYMLNNTEIVVDLQLDECKELLVSAALNGNVNIVNILLEKITKYGKSCVKDLEYNTLVTAASAGHIDVIYALIDRDVDINGNTICNPLHIAADNGHKDIVELLILRGADKNAQDEHDNTPLHLAADNGHIDAVEALLRHGASVIVKSKTGRTALHNAACFGQVDVVKILLKYNAERDVEDVHKWTPFCLAVNNCNDAAAKILLPQSSNVNKKDENLRTPLFHAAMRGNFDIVKALLDTGADVAVKDDREITPLHMAAVNGHTDVVHLLISNCAAEVDAACVGSRTPLHLAAANGHLAVCKELIDGLAVVDATDGNSCTPLHVAVEDGNQNIVSLLLENNANVNVQNRYGLTPLHLAVLNDHKKVVEMLIKRNEADVNVGGQCGSTALHKAAENGFTDILNMLLSKEEAQPDAIDRDSFAPLHFASLNGHKYSVFALLNGGANVDARGMNNQTPLHLAAENDHTDVCRTLIRNNASVNAIDDFGCTPLHIAAKSKSTNVVRIFLDNEAGVDIKNGDGYTSLHLAAYFGDNIIARVLLDHGADKETSNNLNLKPLQTAAQRGNSEVVRSLIDLGAEIEAKSDMHWTALHLAAWHGHEQVVSLLIEKGAKVNAVDNACRTPLFFAAEKRHRNICDILLSNGASLGTLNAYNVTLLHLAARSNKEQVIRILLESGSDINAPTLNGLTALHVAVGEGHVDIVKVLLEKEAMVNVVDNHCMTPLHVALERQKPEIALLLIESGANVESRANQELTPLHMAARYNLFNIVNTLLEKNVEIDAIAFTGATALYLAAEAGHQSVVELLLEKSAAINAQDVNCLTPLHVATLNEHLDIVQILINNGANANLKDRNGDSPFTIALDMISSLADRDKLEMIAALIMSVTDVENLSYDKS